MKNNKISIDEQNYGLLLKYIYMYIINILNSKY